VVLRFSTCECGVVLVNRRSRPVQPGIVSDAACYGDVLVVERVGQCGFRRVNAAWSY
jgi:hypothetical protein